jgi:hypothetical protein
MIGVLKKFCMVFLIIHLAATTSHGQDDSEARELYLEAKMKCVQQEWTAAIGILESLLDKFPISRYADDAKFWIGYCLEKIPDQRIEAFDIFAQLVNKYPNSPWKDDAEIHQINLAEQLVHDGEATYRIFLYDKMINEQNDIRYRAAIALGRLGDKKALPLLQTMQSNEDYGNLARELTTVLQTEKMSPEEVKKKSKENELDLIYEGETIEPEKEEEGKGFLWFGSQRYEQYRSMLRKDDNWIREELTDFAFWHILDSDTFEEYQSLTDAYDKKEWKRKYCKRKDPTPTTEENEFEDEFERRVEYARAKFSSFWNYLNFKYLPDQHLRLGWAHAPWDARGELYIKYGEPDMRTHEGWHREEWTYYRYGVDFLVKQYMTNIYGNAIHAGEMSIRKYSVSGGRYGPFSRRNDFNYRQNNDFYDMDSYLQANFIYNNEIRYSYDYKANPINEIELMIDQTTSGGKYKIIFNYRFPIDQFEMVSKDGGLEIAYKEVYCVLDEDLREVARDEAIRQFKNIPDEDQTFEQNILVNLPLGKYTLYLRIEDQNASNLGIFSKEFEVGRR